MLVDRVAAEAAAHTSAGIQQLDDRLQQKGERSSLLRINTVAARNQRQCGMAMDADYLFNSFHFSLRR